MKRVFGEDAYVGRFFRHVQEKGGNQVTNATEMIIKTLKWRKESGIGRLTESDLDPELKAKSVIYSHGRDVDGKKLLVFDITRHSKGKNIDASKRMFLYWLERLER